MNKFGLSEHTLMYSMLASILIHKELHSGGNYTYTPIGVKVFPDLGLPMIKLPYNTTLSVPWGYLSSSSSRSS